MKRKRLLRLIILLACVIGLLFAAAYEPTHIGRGLLRNEAFFRGYPTGYWREVVGADGRAGAIDINTAMLLEDPRAVSVLLECLADPDPNVRWPSVILLQRAGSPREVEPALRGALDDEDLDVRFQAMRALARLRRAAMQAVPRLVELSKDDDLRISTRAHYALWEIDPETASAAGGWREFTSAKWQFSVIMPGPPEEEVGSIDTLYGRVPIHSFGVSYGVARCTVAVSEYSPESTEDLSLEERFDSAVGETATALGGSLIRYQPIEQHGYSGRVKLIKIDGKATSHTRLFPVARRGYQINITYPPGDVVSPTAEDFFLGSLRITYTPKPAAEETKTQEGF